MSKSPDAFRSIGEVSSLVGVAPHVLRYWESQFTQLAPVKRGDGRRYYRPDDVRLVAGLCQVMREEGLSIRGARRLIAADRGAGLRKIGALRLGEMLGDQPGPAVRLALPETLSDAAAALQPEPARAAAFDPVPQPVMNAEPVVDQRGAAARLDESLAAAMATLAAPAAGDDSLTLTAPAAPVRKKPAPQPRPAPAGPEQQAFAWAGAAGHPVVEDRAAESPAPESPSAETAAPPAAEDASWLGRLTQAAAALRRLQAPLPAPLAETLRGLLSQPR